MMIHIIEAVNFGKDALMLQDYFGVGDLFTTSDLFDAKVHLGHKEGLRNKYMTPYLLGKSGNELVSLLHFYSAMV